MHLHLSMSQRQDSAMQWSSPPITTLVPPYLVTTGGDAWAVWFPWFLESDLAPSASRWPRHQCAPQRRYRSYRGSLHYV